MPDPPLVAPVGRARVARAMLPASLPALALTLLLSGCGTGVEQPGQASYRPWLYAVTVPDSLAPGQTVTLWAHCSVECGEIAVTLRPVYERPGRLGLALWGESSLGVICLDQLGYDQSLAHFTAQLPRTGPLTVVFYGKNDSLAVTLDPAAPPGRGHTVELERAGTHEPVAGALGYFKDWRFPPDTLATFVTDASGRVTVHYAYDPNEPLFWMFVPWPDHWPSAWVQFQPSAPFVNRPLRTRALYYGQPAPSAWGSATGWSASAATYESGSPWWRSPARMASR